MPDITGQMTQAANLQVLADATTAITGTFLPTNVIDLFINDVPFNIGSPIGTYTLPTYTGYGAEAVAWGAATTDDNGDVVIQGVVGEFRPADAVTPNNIFGWLLRNAAGDILGGGNFFPSLPMNSALDNLILTPEVVFPLRLKAGLVT